jgi:hypothetical protein
MTPETFLPFILVKVTNNYFLSLSKDIVRAAIPPRNDIKKNPIAFASPAKVMYLSIVLVIVIAEIVKAAIATTNGLMFKIICIV